MIRKGSACEIEYREHMRDGDGTVQLTNFITGPEELCQKGRLFSKITLNPGCGIGYHVHENETELFYFIDGCGRVQDDETFYDVCAGDSMCTMSGHGHSVENTGDTDLIIVAVIITD